MEYHQNFTTNNSLQLYSFIRLLESNSRPDCPQLESLELSRRYQSKLHDITRAHSPNRQPVACFSLPQVADGYLKREHGDSANGLPKVISTQSAASATLRRCFCRCFCRCFWCRVSSQHTTTSALICSEPESRFCCRESDVQASRGKFLCLNSSRRSPEPPLVSACAPYRPAGGNFCLEVI